MTKPTDDHNELGLVSPLGPDRTVEQALARELRRAIIDGRLRPGTRLRYRELAKQFGVSVTPVRIALRELLQEGLIDMRPHEGAHVTPLSVEELEEVYAARAGFEGWLARRGAPALTDDDLRKMERRLANVEEAVAKSDLDAFLRSAWSHRTICYRAAHREALMEKVEVLFQRSARYNWLTLRAEGRLDESMAGLRDFHAACEAHDGERAKLLMRQALDRTLEDLVGRLTDELDSRASDETLGLAADQR
jgi:DNA-binding GntR family transcriptional regulator